MSTDTPMAYIAIHDGECSETCAAEPQQTLMEFIGRAVATGGYIERVPLDVARGALYQPWPPVADSTLAIPDDEDNEHHRCFACGQAFKLGDMVFNDADGGRIHAECIGSDHEAFVDLDTGNPLAADDPMPVPHAWFPDTPETAAAYAAGRAAIQAVQEAQWQDISTAPRDGTLVDLHDGERRLADCYWGVPDHCCGEAGQYCDSEWHLLEPGWVDGTFNEMLDDLSDPPTHWMPRPERPPLPLPPLSKGGE